MKIKYTLVLLLLSFSFLGLSLKPSLAKTSEERLAQQTEQQEQRAARVALAQDQRFAQIADRLERVVRKFYAAIDRLTHLSGRIARRLVIISEADPEFDPTPYEARLEEADDLLAEAKTELDEFVASLPELKASLLESDNPLEVWIGIKEDLSGIRSKLSEAHQILVHIIGNVKGLRYGTDSQQ